MVFCIEKAKSAALCFAEDSNSNNCLFKSTPDEDSCDYSKGGPETLDSLALLVTNEGVYGMENDDAEAIVLRHLKDSYPRIHQ